MRSALRKRLFETEFEETVFKLRLAESDWGNSTELRQWVERHCEQLTFLSIYFVCGESVSESEVFLHNLIGCQAVGGV
jgi:hypothetical protein